MSNNSVMMKKFSCQNNCCAMVTGYRLEASGVMAGGGRAAAGHLLAQPALARSPSHCLSLSEKVKWVIAKRLGTSPITHSYLPRHSLHSLLHFVKPTMEIFGKETFQNLLLHIPHYKPSAQMLIVHVCRCLMEP